MRAIRPAAALIALASALALGSAPALAAPAPDPVAACDGTAYTTATVDGRDVVTCTDGRLRDWQRVRIADAQVVRGTSTTTTLRFVVTRPEAGNAVVMSYATADVTAHAGTDYTASTGTLVLEADETHGTIDVPVLPRERGEDLTMRIVLGDDSGVVRFVRDHAVGLIENRSFRVGQRYDADWLCDGGFYSLPARPDGDTAVACLGRPAMPWTTFSVGSPTVDPQAGVATFEILRPQDPWAPVFLRYETADGTARAGVDYTATSGTIAMRYQQTRIHVTVPVNPDAVADGDRTFSLRLSRDGSGSTISADDGTATIRHLAPPLGIARVGQPLTGAPDASTWQWQRCDDAGACEDLPGASSASYAPTVDDAGQRLRLLATAPALDGGMQRAATPISGTVRAAAPATPTILTGPPSVTMAREASFTVSGGELDARYECAVDGGAFADCGAGPTLTLTGLPLGRRRVEVRQRTADGLASAAAAWSWSIVARSDPVAACDGTAYTVRPVAGRDLVDCADGAVRAWQRVAIRDARIVRSASDVTRIAFTVTRPEAGSPVFLDWSTEEVTAGAGFIASSGLLALEADQTSTTIEVPVLPALAGDDAQFAVRLVPTGGSEIAFDRDRAVGTIANEGFGRRSDGESACDGGLYDIIIVNRLPVVRCLNGPGPIGTFADAPARADRHAGAVTFKLERGSDASPNWVAYETVDGTARAGVDYTATSGTIALGSGRRVAYVRVPVNPETVADGDRTFSLRLSAGSAAPVAERELVATIRHGRPAGGTPRVGQPLGGSAAGDATSRQWERCDENGACLALPGANGAAYAPVTADLGRRLRVRATVPGDEGATIVVHTPLTAPVRAAAIAVPSISGGPGPGEVTESREAAFALAGKEDDAIYECSLGDAEWSACAADGEVRLTGLRSGVHTLSVRQRTIDGLVSNPGARSWTVAARPDPAAVCDGTSFSSSTRDGRQVVRCDDGLVRDWQRVSITDAHVVRGTSGERTLAFTVSRPRAGSPLFLTYATVEKSARGSIDVDPMGGTVVMEADQRELTIEATALASAAGGDDLRFAVELGDAQGDVVEFARRRGIGTIANESSAGVPDGDEACDGGAFDIVTVDGERVVRCFGGVGSAGTFEATVAHVDPLAGTASFRLERRGTGSPVHVAYETVDGTARAGVDYTATSGTVKLGYRRRVAYVTVPVDPAAGAGGERRFSLRLSAGRTSVPIAAPDLPATIRRGGSLGVARLGRPLSGAAAATGATAWRWERCDPSGACLGLPGATGERYEPTAADVGGRLRLRATVAGDEGEEIVLRTPLSAPVRGAATAPSLSGGPAEGAETAATSATFALSGKEDDAAYECSLDASAFAPCGDGGGGGGGGGASVTLDGLAPGPHTLALRQRTVDGLESAAATRSWTVVRPVGPDPDGRPRPIPTRGEGGDPSLEPTTPPAPRVDPPAPVDPPREQPPGGDGGGTGTPPGGVEPGPDPDPAETARVTGRRQQARSVADAVAGRTNVVLRCSAACALDAPLAIGRAAARRLGLRGVLIGRATGAGDAAGLVRLRVRFDARAKARLLRMRGALTVVATVPNPRGRAVTVRFVLRPVAR